MKLGIKPVERSTNIFDFSNTFVVLSLAQSSSAEVEAQHGEPKAVQRLHRVKHDFVVKCPAEQRMRMTHNRRVSCILGSRIEQSFKASCRTVEKK